MYDVCLYVHEFEHSNPENVHKFLFFQLFFFWLCGRIEIGYKDGPIAEKNISFFLWILGSK